MHVCKHEGFVIPNKWIEVVLAPHIRLGKVYELDIGMENNLAPHIREWGSFWFHIGSWRILGPHTKLEEGLTLNMEQRLHMFILTYDLIKFFVSSSSQRLQYTYTPIFPEDLNAASNEEL